MMDRNVSTDTLPHLLHSLIPSALQPFFLLSYPVSSYPAFLSTLKPFRPAGPTILYDKGSQDFCFVAFCVFTFTILREVVVRWVLWTFAWSWLSWTEQKGERISGRQLRVRQHKATRFAEQGWSFCYCSVFWTLGMVGGHFSSQHGHAELE